MGKILDFNLLQHCDYVMITIKTNYAQNWLKETTFSKLAAND